MSATTRRGPRTTHAKSNKQSRPTIFWTGEPKDGDAGVDVAPSIGAPCSASARDGGLNADAEANDCGVVDWVAKTDCYSHGRAFDSLDTLEWSGQLAEGAFGLGAEGYSFRSRMVQSGSYISAILRLARSYS
jgi:hypothetical protein